MVPSRSGTFLGPDGLRLAYRRSGDGPPLVCIPGGPGRTPDYFGDLGGLGGLGGLAGRELIFLDLRGTGSSQVPDDPATYRADRMTGDVEALREHLGLDQLDLLAHSAGADLALLYAARYPERLSRLVLLAPSLSTVGIEPSLAEFHALLARRSDEPWYEEAIAAVRAMEAGDTSPPTRHKYRPFLYGRWDEAARAHNAASVPSPSVAAGWAVGDAVSVAEIRELLGKVTGPVLLYAGELDSLPTPAACAEAAALFPSAKVVVQPGTGHFLWVDDPAGCARTLAEFLG